MAYFAEDHELRFKMWSDSIGPGKTMIGVALEFNDLDAAIAAAKWQPSDGRKAGILVYTANVDAHYTRQVFQALAAPTSKSAASKAPAEISTPAP